MGRKGRQRKAKRAPAVSTPVPRRLAAETGNSASSVSSCGVQGGREQSARPPPPKLAGNKKHNRSSAVLKNEYALLKMKEWQAVVEQIVAKMPPGTSMNVYQCLFPKTNRLFICRNMNCSELGSFFGDSKEWISTCGADGWRFACPHCVHPYTMNLQNKRGIVPGNYIWHFEEDQSVILAEWPDTVTENAMNESAALMAEHAVTHEFDKLSHSEVQVKIALAVSKTAVKCGELRTMKLSDKVMTHIAHRNANCGTTKLPYSCDHLIANGYRGSFYKFVPGVTPVMKAADCMDYLSLMFCYVRTSMDT